jgi:hypothetical protein
MVLIRARFVERANLLEPQCSASSIAGYGARSSSSAAVARDGVSESYSTTTSPGGFGSGTLSSELLGTISSNRVAASPTFTLST